jgi:hypothetical protein
LLDLGAHGRDVRASRWPVIVEALDDDCIGQDRDTIGLDFRRDCSDPRRGLGFCPIVAS